MKSKVLLLTVILSSISLRSKDNIRDILTDRYEELANFFEPVKNLLEGQTEAEKQEFLNKVIPKALKACPGESKADENCIYRILHESLKEELLMRSKSFCKRVGQEFEEKFVGEKMECICMEMTKAYLHSKDFEKYVYEGLESSK